MTAKQRRRARLLEWVVDQYPHEDQGPPVLVTSLQVENLPYDQIPPCHYRAIVEFRRLHTTGRIATCRRFLADRQTATDLCQRGA